MRGGKTYVCMRGGGDVLVYEGVVWTKRGGGGCYEGGESGSLRKLKFFYGVTQHSTVQHWRATGTEAAAHLHRGPYTTCSLIRQPWAC